MLALVHSNVAAESSDVSNSTVYTLVYLAYVYMYGEWIDMKATTLKDTVFLITLHYGSPLGTSLILIFSLISDVSLHTIPIVYIPLVVQTLCMPEAVQPLLAS